MSACAAFGTAPLSANPPAIIYDFAAIARTFQRLQAASRPFVAVLSRSDRPDEAAEVRLEDYYLIGDSE